MKVGKSSKPDASANGKIPLRKTFRSAEPVGKGTISTGFLKALKEIEASPDLIRWAEDKVSNGVKPVIQ